LQERRTCLEKKEEMEKGIQGPKSPLSLLPQPVNQEATKIKKQTKENRRKKRIRCENGR
jgi:hypothetical protein